MMPSVNDPVEIILRTISANRHSVLRCSLCVETGHKA